MIECMPNLISQERMEIEPCYRKSNSMIENYCCGNKKENKDCTHRLDLNSPLYYVLVPEHVAKPCCGSASATIEHIFNGIGG